MLRALPHVRLVNAVAGRVDPPAPGTYLLLESFPTSTWRTARLRPLPAKAKTAATAPFAAALVRAFGLPEIGAASHDDLQAVVAALPAAALLGGPTQAVPRGEPGRLVDGYWVEGLIWDAVPAPVVAADAPLLVVVTGPPASGKTTVAEALARELEVPLVAKDAIKETLFEVFGTGDRAWSQSLGRATFELLFARVAAELRAGRPVIAEANFEARSVERFAELPPARVVQIHLTAPAQVLLERFAARERHPGHLDGAIVDEVRAAIESGRHPTLPLGGELLELDASGPVDVTSVCRRIQTRLRVP